MAVSYHDSFHAASRLTGRILGQSDDYIGTGETLKDTDQSESWQNIC